MILHNLQDNNFYSPMRENKQFSLRMLPASTWRAFRNILKWAIPSIIAFITVLILLGAIFQQRVIMWVANNIKNEIAIPVNVGNIKFSLLENFPNASAILSDFVAYYPNTVHSDTLISIKKIYLNINILSLLDGTVSIRSIDFNTGSANYIENSNGSAPSFNLWKSKQRESSSPTPFSIRSIYVKSLALHYWRRGLEAKKVIFVDKLNFKGDVLSDRIRGNATIGITDCRVDSSFIDQAIDNSAKIKLTGEYVYFKNISLQNLTVKTPKIEISGTLAVQNKEGKNSGKFQFIVQKIDPKFIQHMVGITKLSIGTLGRQKLTINGTIFGPNLTDLHFVANWEIHGGIIKISNDLTINNISYNANLEGKINHNVIHPLKITCDDLIFDLNGKSIMGKFSIIPPTKMVNITSRGDISPAILARILHINSPNFSGDNISFTLSLISDNLLISKVVYSDMNINGSIDLNKLNLQLNHFNLHDISGRLEIGDTLSFKNLSIDGDLGKLNLDGIIPHWKQSFLSSTNRSPIEITGSVKSPLLNLDLPSWGISQDSNNTIPVEDTLGTPLKIGQITLDFFANNFIIYRLRGDNARGTLTYIPGELFSIANTSLHSFGGQINFSLKNRLKAKTTPISIEGNIERVDIDSLFNAFNNFNQKFITAENISGKITLDFQLLGEMQKGSLLNDSLHCITNLTIENGILKHFEPLKRLSKFISLKELETIKFQKLTNVIHIDKGIITIPKMYVENSALNLSVSGTHELMGAFDYRLQLRLSDVLWRKKQESSTFRPDLGIVEQKESSGGSVYLRIFGNIDNYKVVYDKKMAIELLSNKLKAEGAELINIFKSDKTTDKQLVPSKKNSKFVIKEEITKTNKNEESDTSQAAPLKKNSGFKIDWD